MTQFDISLPIDHIPAFDPGAKSDEVVVQIVEKKVEVEKIKTVRTKAPEPIVKTVYLPAPATPQPNLTREALNEIVAAIGSMAATRPNVEVSVAPTPLSIAPAAIQVTPQITVNERPTPTKWVVEVVERDTSPEKRIKKLTIEAVV